MEDFADIAKSLKQFEPRAIALWGSYGLGLNDRFTHDVDIVVYVDKMPDKKTKKRVFAALSDGSVPMVELPWEADFFPHKRLLCEVVFKSCAELEENSTYLLDGDYRAEDDAANFIQYTKPIFDDGWLAAQKDRIKAYPPKLLKMNIYLHLFNAWRQVHYYDRAQAKRKQPFWAELCINEGTESIIRTLFAANHAYYGKEKWAEVQARSFELKPNGFDEQLVKLMRSRQLEDYKQLLEDVSSFLEQHFPKECAGVQKTDAKLTEIDELIEASEKE